MGEDTLQINNAGTMVDVTVEQLLGFDLQQVEEVRGFPLAPEGVYEWRIMEWSNKSVEWMPKDATEKIKSMVLECLLECILCRQTKDPEIDKTSLVGMQYTEGFFLSSAEDLGRVKALFVDIGMSGAGTVQTLCDQSIGKEFVAPLTHRKDKNDTSKVYANLDRTAVEPLGGGAANLASDPLAATPAATAAPAEVAKVAADAAVLPAKAAPLAL